MVTHPVSGRRILGCFGSSFAFCGVFTTWSGGFSPPYSNCPHFCRNHAQSCYRFRIEEQRQFFVIFKHTFFHNNFFLSLFFAVLLQHTASSLSVAALSYSLKAAVLLQSQPNSSLTALFMIYARLKKREQYSYCGKQKRRKKYRHSITMYCTSYGAWKTNTLLASLARIEVKNIYMFRVTFILNVFSLFRLRSSHLLDKNHSLESLLG